MLAPYRTLLAVPGATRFAVSAVLAHLGAAMLGVSTIAMIVGRRGSYDLAGAVSGIGLLGLALGGPVLGRLVDRRGQSVVGLPAAFGAVALLAGLGLACHLGAPAWALAGLSLGNALLPQVSTLARTRWAHVVGDDADLLHTATSFEQVTEELCFMAGPAVGAYAAAAVAPEAGFALALALYLCGIVLLLLQRSTEPPVHVLEEHHDGSVLRLPGLLLVTLGLTLTGCVFGSLDVSVIAFAGEHGLAAWGGLTLGTCALGSAIGGLVYGTRPMPGGAAPRLVWCHLAMFALLTPVAVVTSLPVMLPTLFVAGIAIAPTLITGTLLAQRLVPAARLTEGMTVVSTGLLLGIAAGSWVGGHVITGWGAHRAFVIPVAAAGLAVLVAALGRSRVVAAEPRP